MKLVTYLHRDKPGFGWIDGDRVRDLGLLLPEIADLKALLALSEGRPAHFLRAYDLGRAPGVPLSEVALLAPISKPDKYLAIGGNYRAHRAESVAAAQAAGAGQIWFNKQVSCIAGPYDDVIRPVVSEQLDYEGELGVVIGRRCRSVRAEEAHEFVAGYMVCNDLSVRDWQARAPTATLGKSFDTHGPIGPWLTTADEIGSTPDLRLQTWVNGELRQEGRTSDMVATIGEMIAELSIACTLEPGDVLATGTPAGIGKAMIPPRYLRPGDVVRVEIERLGALENRIVDAATTSAMIGRMG